MKQFIVFHHGKELCYFTDESSAKDFVRQSREGDFQCVLYEKLPSKSGKRNLRIVEVGNEE